MAKIDHLILNVNEIASSVDFYVNVLGFELEGEDGPFTVIRVNDDFTLPYGDSYHAVGNNNGPGVESGARGSGSNSLHE